jgi:hypothetical protein
VLVHPNTRHTNTIRRKSLWTSPVDKCTIGNRNAPRIVGCAMQASKRVGLLRRTFENFTVVAFALVAKYW